MPSITVPSDYIGKFEISQNPRETQKLQGYIDLYEDQYMMELFGVEFYNEYKAGLALPTPDPLFVKLRDPFAEDSKGYCSYSRAYGFYSNKVLISKGVKTMLLGFIYWEFFKDDFSKTTINGKSKVISENSVNSSTFLAGLHARYNESVDTYRAIQSYIEDNGYDYQRFKGQYKLLANWF